MQENTRRPRQLIACCDGTDNTLTGGEHDTNVLKLRNLLDPDANDQVIFYDPGVGVADQLPATSYWDAFTRKWERWQGLTSGKGIYENIGNTYRFLVENYREGDQIFLFGFSRGAFTARCVAGMVNLFGIIRPENVDLVGTMINVYFSRRDDAEAKPGKCNTHDVAAQIRDNFTNPSGRDAAVYFLGVWDIVASVGMPLMRTAITGDSYTSHKRVLHIRHALSLDETRSSFQPLLYWDGNYDWGDRSLKQLWFQGVHSDVGGGYIVSESRLSDGALEWMVAEADARGLRLASPPPAASDDTRAVVVHNQTLAAPQWVITGLKARSQQLPKEVRRRVDADARARSIDAARKPPPYQPEAGPTRAATGRLVFKRPGRKVARQFGGALLMMAVFWLMTALYGTAAVDGRLQWVSLSHVIDGARQFDHWQRTLVLSIFDAGAAYRGDGGIAGMLGQWGALPFSPDNPRIAYAMWSVVWDFAFIGAYSWVLGFFAVRAFARRAGLRRVGEEPGLMLGLLGAVPGVVILADFAENAATMATMAFTVYGLPILPWISAAAMSCANIAKWFFLFATLLLFAVNFVMHREAAASVVHGD